MGEQGDEEDKEYLKTLKNANKALKDAGVERGTKISDIVSGADPAIQKEYNAMTAANEAYVNHATDGWEGRIIRRGNESTLPDGVTLITQHTPPLTVTDAWIVIPPEELAQIDLGADAAEAG